MKRPLETDRLESAAGLSLLSMAAVAKLAAAVPAPLPRWAAGAFLVVSAAIILGARLFRARPVWRWLRVFAAAAWLAAAALFGLSGAAEASFFALTFSAAFAWAAASDRKAEGAVPLDLLRAAVGVFLAGYGLIAVVRGFAPAAIPAASPSGASGLLFGAGLFIAGVFITVSETLDWRAWKKDAAGLAAAVGLALAARFGLMAGLTLSAVAFAVTAVVIVVSRLLDDSGRFVKTSDEGEAPSELAGIKENDWLAELVFWLAVIVLGVYVEFLPAVNAGIFYLTILAMACLARLKARLSPALRYSPTVYFIMALAVTGVFLGVVESTGGLYSLFVPLGFLLVLGGTVLPKPWQIGAVVGLVVAYLCLKLGLAAGAHDPGLSGLAVRAAFLVSALGLAAAQGYALNLKRLKAESGFREAKAELEVALAAAGKERAVYERQAQEAKKRGEDLLGMREALMNVLEDVEESKRQLELDHSRDSAIFEALGEGLVAADARGRIFLFNPKAAEITGLSQAEALGRPISEVIRCETGNGNGDGKKPDLLKPVFGGKAVKFPPRAELLRSDGRRVAVAGTAAPFFGAEGAIEGVVAAFSDVTVERQIDRQKSGFISIASHQLRTPLSAIRWYLDMLKEHDAGPLTAQQEDFIDDVYVSTVRMIKLVGDLLNVSRIEEGKIPVNRAPIDLRELCRSLADEFRLAAGRKKIKFSCVIEDGLPKLVTDGALMRQAVGNLVSNAVNYTGEGGAVTLRAGLSGGEVVFEVSDTGVGIPDDERRRLFEKFFRGRDAVARETTGSGLGLFICRTLIEALGGRVWFESAFGQGSRFFAALPVKTR